MKFIENYFVLNKKILIINDNNFKKKIINVTNYYLKKKLDEVFHKERERENLWFTSNRGSVARIILLSCFAPLRR